MSFEIGPRPTDKLAALTLHIASFYFNFYLTNSIYSYYKTYFYLSIQNHLICVKIQILCFFRI